MKTTDVRAWELEIEFGKLDANYAQELCDALVEQYGMPAGIFMDIDDEQYIAMLDPPMDRPGLIFFSASTHTSPEQHSQESAVLEPTDDDLSSATYDLGHQANVGVDLTQYIQLPDERLHLQDMEFLQSFQQPHDMQPALDMHSTHHMQPAQNLQPAQEMHIFQNLQPAQDMQPLPVSITQVNTVPTAQVGVAARPAARARTSNRAGSHRVTKTMSTHIPRPRNSWIIYRQDRTKDLRAQDASLTASEISRIVSALWRDELAHVRGYYQQLAQDEAQAHRERYPNYRYRARRPVDRHSRVDTAAFWDTLPNLDTDEN